MKPPSEYKITMLYKIPLSLVRMISPSTNTLWRVTFANYLPHTSSISYLGEKTLVVKALELHRI